MTKATRPHTLTTATRRAGHLEAVENIRAVSTSRPACRFTTPRTSRWSIAAGQRRHHRAGHRITYAPKLAKTSTANSPCDSFFLLPGFQQFQFRQLRCALRACYYVPKLHNLTLRANLDYKSPTGTDNFDDSSRMSHSLNAEVPIPIGRCPQISLGASAHQFPFFTPLRSATAERFRDYAGYAVNLSRNFSLNAAGSLVVRPTTRRPHGLERNSLPQANYRFAIVSP